MGLQLVTPNLTADRLDALRVGLLSVISRLRPYVLRWRWLAIHLSALDHTNHFS